MSGAEDGGLRALAWRWAEAPQALAALAGAAGLEGLKAELPRTPPWVLSEGEGARGTWLSACADWLEVEMEAVDAAYPDVADMLALSTPALVALPGAEALLAVVRRRGSRLVVLSESRGLQEVTLASVRQALCREAEGTHEASVLRVLDEARVPLVRRERARAALLRELLGSRRVGGVWMLRLPPGASYVAQLRRAGVLSQGGTLALACVGQTGLWLLSWWLLGRGALQGNLAWGWLLAWGLVLLAMVPLRLLSAWSSGRLAVDAGALLKQRLLAGALRLEPEEIRRQGAGQLLGRVIESEAVESLSSGGGLSGIVAVVELAMALAVLAVGAGGLGQQMALWVSLAALIFVTKRYSDARRRWTRARLDMTHDLVERMAGHRTRRVQEPPARWHDGEDGALERYLGESQNLDRLSAWLTVALPDAWLVFGVLGLAGAFASRASQANVAVALGGVLLAYQALARLSLSLTQWVGASIAWDSVRDLFQAAARTEGGSPTVARARAPQTFEKRTLALVEGSGLFFRYPGRSEPVLRGCSVRIARGARLLLEGPSGGGKSTLGAILSGLRKPDSGLLLLEGLDRQTLGLAGWRERVVAAPQFHENHVLSGTLAFNLLMGRGWPSGPEALREAEEICRALALGGLLDRMPAGLHQMVGETGWQLSHGERSRLYIARALLQKAELLVLDESFAAMDPATLCSVMECVMERAPTLLVIAHP